MKVTASTTLTHNPCHEADWASGLRENLTSRSYGEGLETGRILIQAPRQSFTRQLVFKSWKSDLHLATLSTKTQEPTLCYLYGRLLLIVLAYALCPALRAALWIRQQRELSFLKLIRYLQTLADRWLQTLFAPPATLYHWLCHVCESAQRIIAKASRTCRTSAQRLRESLEAQHDCIELTIKLAA